MCVDHECKRILPQALLYPDRHTEFLEIVFDITKLILQLTGDPA